jgi:hypothetical protein
MTMKYIFYFHSQSGRTQTAAFAWMHIFPMAQSQCTIMMTHILNSLIYSDILNI